MEPTTEEDSGFDYEYLGHCEFGVPDNSRASGVSDCGEHAIAKVWWNDSQPMLVCPEHFKEIYEQEVKP